MILGFGNNVVSSLASDITASQTTFSVIPGDGQLFAALLTSDFSNKSTALKTYAKITLTDSGETAFEVCHLTAVNGDTLTVIRGQEGTAAKGWSLKDVVANFATRGSENAFPQIAHIQSGFYTSGTAGGTANALTMELPTTFFLNGSADWVLKTPIVVYPTQNNTGAATLQLTMGGRVLGTFPLYKGNKAALVANDILKDVALVCLMDNTKSFFNVANPGAIYAGLGTAAFKDIVTSMADFSTGRIPVVGWMGLGGIRDTRLANENFASFWRDTSIAKSGITIPYDGSPTVSYFAIDGANQHAYVGRKPPGGNISWVKLYSEFNKPTASDADAVSASQGGTFQRIVTFNQGLTSRGKIAWGDYVSAVGSSTYNAMVNVSDSSGKTRWAFGPYVNSWSIYAYNADGSYKGNVVNIDFTTFNAAFAAQVIPNSYANFDARYQAKGSYTPAGQAYTKAESDARYQLKNTASRATNGWYKDASTGMIFQWGTIMLPASGSRTTSAAFSFPMTFPNAALNLQTTPANAGVSNNGYLAITAGTSLSASGGTIYADSNNGERFSKTQTVRYFAVGY